MRLPPIEITLPPWVEDFAAAANQPLGSMQARMEFVIELARRNVEHDLGGPFGAAIFETESGKLIAPGVNRVVACNCCVLHAEIVAIMTAQRALGTFTLAAPGLPACELVTSTEPCAMCLGAVCWSGVRRLVCGARDEDARAIGFDEGPKTADWVRALEARGITVARDVCRDKAQAVLQYYVEKGGIIYNATSNVAQKPNGPGRRPCPRRKK